MTPPDPNREIYPAAPLKLVACEIRFPLVPRFERSDGQNAVYEALREEYQILGPPPMVNIQLGPAGSRQEQYGARFLDRQRTKSVVLLSTALTLETSAYVRFEEFAAVVERVLKAAHHLGEIPAVERVGLRYLDEIEVPGVTGAAAWSEYVMPDLLAPAKLFHDMSLSAYQGGMQLRVDEQHLLGVRFGIQEVPIVDPNGPLRIERSPVGEYFLLDVDSAWTAPAKEMPAFDLGDIMELLARLHSPVREIFERSITGKLRDEVLRKEPA